MFRPLVVAVFLVVGRCCHAEVAVNTHAVAHCGQRCLYEAALRLEHYATLADVFAVCGERPETSMLELRDAAVTLGLRATGYAVTTEDLATGKYLPAIVHVRESHFVLLTGVGERWEVFDPPGGYGEQPPPSPGTQFHILHLEAGEMPLPMSAVGWLWAATRSFAQDRADDFYYDETKTYTFIAHNRGRLPVNVWWGAPSRNDVPCETCALPEPLSAARIAPGATVEATFRVVATATDESEFVTSVPLHHDGMGENPLIFRVRGRCRAPYVVVEDGIGRVAAGAVAAKRVRVIGATRPGDSPLEILAVETPAGFPPAEVARVGIPWVRRKDAFEVVLRAPGETAGLADDDTAVVVTNAPTRPRIPVSLRDF